jgi:hypothetical protein
MIAISEVPIGSVVEYRDKFADGWLRVYRFKVLAVKPDKVRVLRTYSAHFIIVPGRKRPRYKFRYRHRIPGSLHPKQPVTVLQ